MTTEQVSEIRNLAIWRREAIQLCTNVNLLMIMYIMTFVLKCCLICWLFKDEMNRRGTRLNWCLWKMLFWVWANWVLLLFTLKAQIHPLSNWLFLIYHWVWIYFSVGNDSSNQLHGKFKNGENLVDSILVPQRRKILTV